MAPTVSSSVGVAGALAGRPAVRTASALFSLENRVALVTGGHRGIGLEMALALAEAGAVVYCLDLPSKPDSDWLKVQAYAADLPDLETGKKGRLEYVSGDVTDQKAMWTAVEDIVEREGRIDVCMANAGILHGAECLDYTAEDFRKVNSYCHPPLEKLA
jgi:NAD(P)-dependent dehydrogenase (short-subunit alcohol dehydrogenase family)